MGLRFDSQKYGQCFFVTTSFKNHNRLGEVTGFYEALAESINLYTSSYSARIAAYVFMPSHIHLLLFIDGELLGHFMRDFKKYVSQNASRELGLRDSHLWQRRYDRQVIYSEDLFITKLKYIHENPVRQELVSQPGDWPWSSAECYELGVAGPVRVFKEWV